MEKNEKRRKKDATRSECTLGGTVHLIIFQLIENVFVIPEMSDGDVNKQADKTGLRARDYGETEKSTITKKLFAIDQE